MSAGSLTPRHLEAADVPLDTPFVGTEHGREFFRVLMPGGVVVFQVPSHGRRQTSRAAAAVPMPDAAYNASITLTGVPDTPVTPDTDVTIDVHVLNLSASAWTRSEFGVIRAGNHWLDGSGTVLLARDDGRVSLPGVVRAGDTVRLPLTIRTPREPGLYQCEVDLAHEGA